MSSYQDRVRVLRLIIWHMFLGCKVRQIPRFTLWPFCYVRRCVFDYSILSKSVKKYKPVKYPYCVSCVSVCGRRVKCLSLSAIETVYGFSRKLMGTLCYWIPLLLHTFQSLPAKVTIWRTHEYMRE